MFRYFDFDCFGILNCKIVVIPVAYPGWYTPGCKPRTGVLAPPGKLKNGAPRRRCWMGEGGSMLEVIISFSDNVIGIRLLKIVLTLN